VAVATLVVLLCAAWPVQPVMELGGVDLPPESEGVVMSPPRQEPAFLILRNETSWTLDLIWLDFRGNRDRTFARLIHPHTEHTQPTRPGHAWLLLDQHGQSRGIVRAVPGSRTVILVERVRSAESRSTKRATGEIRCLLGHGAVVNNLVLSADGRQILSAGQDGHVLRWDAGTGAVLGRFKGDSENTAAVAFLTEGLGISTGKDGLLRIWDLEQGKEVESLPGHQGFVYCLAVTPDGSRALSGGVDGTVRLWDLKGRKELRCLTGHTGGVGAVALSGDGRRGLSGGHDGTLRLWDLVSGKELHCLIGHHGSVQAVAFSPDGQRLLSGSWDQTVRLWNASTGQETHRFEGHFAPVWVVAFCREGRQALSGSWDHSIRLWDVKSGNALHEYTGHTGWALGLALTPDPDGRRFWSSGADGTVRLWELPPERGE
jgi:WD40 repeat protein